MSNLVNNEDIIKFYCNKYNFKYDLMGDNIMIKSLRDTWYISNKEFVLGNKIRLMHQNNYGSGGWHYQGSFHNFLHLFQYISNHDDKPFKKNNKMFRIINLLKQIETEVIS